MSVASNYTPAAKPGNGWKPQVAWLVIAMRTSVTTKRVIRSTRQSNQANYFVAKRHARELIDSGYWDAVLIIEQTIISRVKER